MNDQMDGGKGSGIAVLMARRDGHDDEEED